MAAAPILWSARASSTHLGAAVEAADDRDADGGRGALDEREVARDGAGLAPPGQAVVGK